MWQAPMQCSLQEEAAGHSRLSPNNSATRLQQRESHSSLRAAFSHLGPSSPGQVCTAHTRWRAPCRACMRCAQLSCSAVFRRRWLGSRQVWLRARNTSPVSCSLGPQTRFLPLLYRSHTQHGARRRDCGRASRDGQAAAQNQEAHSSRRRRQGGEAGKEAGQAAEAGWCIR